MKILVLLLPIICFAQNKTAEIGIGTDDGMAHFNPSFRSGSTDFVSADIDYEYSILESKAKGNTIGDWRNLRKANRELNYRIWKYNNFVTRRNRINQVKNEDVKSFLAKGNAATARGQDETTLGFNLRTKKTQSNIKYEGIEIVRTLKRDLINLKTTPELPAKFKVVIDGQIADLDRQEKEWRDRKWYGPSDLTPEKIDKLQKELQATSVNARAINTLWETHQKNLKADIEAGLKVNNEAKARLANSITIGGGRIGRGRGPGGGGVDITIGGKGGRDGGGGGGISGGGGGVSGGGGISGGGGGISGGGGGDIDGETLDRIERKTHDFNLSLGEIFRKGEITNINGDLAFRNLNDWSRKLRIDVKTLQNGLKTNDDFIASMKNTPMGIFVDAQIAKAFDGICDKVRACMNSDANLLLNKAVNDSGRGSGTKDLLGPVGEGPEIREAPSGVEK